MSAPDIAYRESVRRLTAENRALRQEIKENAKKCKAEVRVLKAQLREGLSPELLVLRRELQKWRTRATVAEARLQEMRGRSSA